VSRARQVAWAIARAAIGLGLVAWVLARTDFDHRSLSRHAGWVALFSLYPFAGAAIEAWRLRLLLRPLRVPLGFAAGYRMILATSAFNLCLPGNTGGDLLKLVWIGEGRAGSRVEVATFVFLDRAVGLLAFVLAGTCIAALQIREVLASPLLATLAAALAGLAAVGLSLLALGPRLAPRLGAPLSRAGRLGAWIERALATFASVRGRRSDVLAALAVSFVAQVVLVTAYAFAARAMLGREALASNALLAFFGLFANVLPLTPGGLGVGEVAFDRLFALAGAPGGAAVALVGRLGLLPAFAAGLALYASGAHREARRVTQ
jgi:hypothetical protein